MNKMFKNYQRNFIDVHIRDTFDSSLYFEVLKC